MLHKKLRIPKDSAIDIMEELGKLDDCIQFVDLNIHDYSQKKNFGNLIERCEESLKNIQNFEDILQLYGLELVKYTSYQTFKIDLQTDKDNLNKNVNLNYFDLIEIEINDNKKKIMELIESYNNITEQLDLLIEKKSIYDKSSELIFYYISSNILKDNQKYNNNIDIQTPMPYNIIFNRESNDKNINLLEEDETELNFISGVIIAEDDIKFKRMIFRVSRGRAIPTFFDLTIENKALQIKKEKKIFIIFLQGGRNSILYQKILNICDIFSANTFPIPKKERIPKEIFNLQQEIFDKKTYLKSIETSIKDFFKDKIGENGIPGKYNMYKLFFLQEKLLFINLNKCKLRGNFLDGEVWIPKDKYSMIQNTLLKITKKDPNKLTAVLDDIIDYNTIYPPTYFKLNDFTTPFQTIVSEYGIPRYREINPGIFTIITFPFMFGVMFGDIGHGGLLTLLGAWLVVKKYEILKNFPELKLLVKNRYFFLFLGFFAFYNGLIYNDFFAIPLGIFGSCYKNQKKNGKIIATRKNNCIYPIGVDPKWYSAENELTFLNSFKMKISVIIGVLQMILGLMLKGINGIYFKDYIDFLFEFIPQLIFMCLLFGYMIIMIYIKWGTDWSEDPSKAPSIISQLLMLFLNMGSTGENDNKTPLFHREDYLIQEKFQFYALIISIICIPIMLLVKPMLKYFKYPKDENNSINEDEEQKNNKMTITDLAVNQIIETIEYVLGTVSHTASYLRLWALSLAHAQLAKVVFNITLLGFIQSGNILGMFVGFFLLANITLGVLMGMDLLECALHTLRLHWVEFQSKFYHADGYPFSPYSFKYINNEFN